MSNAHDNEAHRQLAHLEMLRERNIRERPGWGPTPLQAQQHQTGAATGLTFAIETGKYQLGWREKLCTWPPWPLSNLYNYLGRLSSAFGWRYVASVILCYGINQGIGESLVYYARRYYVLDDAGLSSYLMTQRSGRRVFQQTTCAKPVAQSPDTHPTPNGR